MRLDFNVLWVDDQPASVDAQVVAIRREMQEEGFDFSHRMCTSIGEVQQSLGDGVFKDEIDLILVDWDLGDNVEGQRAIAQVRESIQYKDIIFYSALKPVDELRALAFQSGLEGIYCARRVDLVQEVIGVFDSLVKKVLDLDHVRGIVVSATSDIDHMVVECLTLMHASHDEQGKAAMLQEAVRRVEKRLKDLTKQVGKLKEATDFAAFLKAHMIFTANDRLRMLGSSLEDGTFQAHATYKVHVDTYRDKVVEDRNMLAHMVLVPQGKPGSVVNNKDEEISLEETRALRKLLLDLRVEFRSLLSALGGPL